MSNHTMAKRFETSLFALRLMALIITRNICFSDICLLHELPSTKRWSRTFHNDLGFPAHMAWVETPGLSHRP